MNRIIFILFCMILVISSSFANVITKDGMSIFAVTSEGTGSKATLNITLIDGTGDIWSKVESLVGISTQNTERAVVSLAKNYSKDVDKYDFKFDIVSDAQVVDGPSAGLPMSMLTISMLEGKNLPDYVSATGTISTTGQVGMIGGVLEKAKAASESGIKLFIVPTKDLEVVVKDTEVKKVDLREYAKKEWNLRVVGVDNLEQALKYAYMNPDDINVDTNIIEEKIIYEPPSAVPNQKLNKLESFVKNYSDITLKNINTATESLDKSSVQNDVLNYLFEQLNQSKDLYKDGNNALVNNYLYSAANYMFLANIGANFVIEASKKPDIMNSGNEMNDKIKSLQEKISKKYEDLNYVPYDDYEWIIAAKERLIWADKYLNEALASVPTDQLDERSANLIKIQKYIFASEWVNISDSFKQNAVDSNRRIDESKYKESAKELLDELDKADKIKKDFDFSESDRYVYGAKVAYKDGSYLTSIFESASALAVINSSVLLKDKDYFEIKEMTDKKYNDINLNDGNFIWGGLYLNHSKYNYSAATFYQDKKRTLDAIENMKSAYKLAYLADNMNNATMQIENNKEITSYPYVSVIKKNIISENNYEFITKVIVILVTLLAIFSIIIFLLYRKYIKTSTYDSAISFTNHQIYKLKSMMVDLDYSYIKKQIDTESYNKLSQKYKNDLKSLENKKEELIAILSDIESLESEINYLNDKLKNTSILFKKGLIDENEYYLRIKEYKKEISDLEYEMKSDNKKITKTSVNKGKDTTKKKGNK